MKNKDLNYGIQLIRIVACLMILLHHLSVAFGIKIGRASCRERV